MTLQAKSSRVWVSFQQEALHCFPAAVNDRNLKTGKWDDVSFLANLHRHMFHVRVDIDVNHDDREIEFIQLKRRLQMFFWQVSKEIDPSVEPGGPPVLGSMSCEMIADRMALLVHKQYPNRSFCISVAEDNENGCIKEYFTV